MRSFLILAALSLFAACSPPNFVSDAEPIRITSQTPDHFELPARFALVRLVYNQVQPASHAEAALWSDLADRSAAVGHFSELQTHRGRYWSGDLDQLLVQAREQRFNYLIINTLNLDSGSAQVAVYHVGSGGLMATTRAVSEAGGRRGFWGGRIRNPALLDRTTLRITNALLPEVEVLLRGMLDRQG